ncbi:unnamed protein product, partial [marine sediment metagenome]
DKIADAEPHLPQVWNNGGVGDMVYSGSTIYFSNGYGVTGVINAGLENEVWKNVIDSAEVGGIQCILLGSLYAGTDTGLWKFSGEISSEGIIPQKAGELKIIVPEGSGTKGTINPTLGGTIPIGFKGSEAGKYTLRIFTQLGEKIYEDTIDATSSEGWFDWVPSEDLASGVYLVHIEGPGINKFRKIAILK